MKQYLRRLLILIAAFWLFFALSPFVLRLFLSENDTPDVLETVSKVSTPSPSPVAETGVFRIYDEAQQKILTVSDEEFLRNGLLCEMSADAPEEALKAQAVAIYTVYNRKRLQSKDDDADFTCDTANRRIYTTEKELKALFGDAWEETKERITSICDSVKGEQLLYDGAPIEASFFAISAGCTQPYENVWSGESYPYLQAVACPSDLLYGDCQTESIFSPEEIQAAFPEIKFTKNPESWFSDPILFDTGYVKSISLCGSDFSGTDIRKALSLRSAAFSITYTDENFVFSTLGWGHGVGMSQTGAIYMAENGAKYEEILSRFYPGTTLQ